MKDPYAVLGVSREAGKSDIKKAYRRLAKELHPDLNPDDSIVEQRFKEVTAAYDLLSDDEKRAQYDRGQINADGSQRHDFAYRRARERAAGAEGAGGFGFTEMDAEDIFSELFGRRGGRRGPQKMRGKDVTYDMTVPFLEAAAGTKRRVSLYDGKSLEVKIPAGCEDGQTLRLKGQGMPGLGGGAAGDAFVTVSVEPHPLFERKDADVYLDVPITLGEAVLGGTITIPAVSGGSLALKVPAGSNTGTVLRLKGKGLPVKGAKRHGDQYARLRVVLPSKPDKDLRDFVEQWSEANAYEVRKDLER